MLTLTLASSALGWSCGRCSAVLLSFDVGGGVVDDYHGNEFSLHFRMFRCEGKNICAQVASCTSLLFHLQGASTSGLLIISSFSHSQKVLI